MRKSRLPQTMFSERRKALRSMCSGGALVLFAAPEIHHVPYRQDSNFFYLTGFEEPGSVAIVRPGMTPEYVLFVRPKNPEMELWDGFRFGVEGAKAEFGADEVYAIDDFEKVSVDLLKEASEIYYRVGQVEARDRKMADVLERVRKSLGRTGKSLLPVRDPQELLGEMRVIKSSQEQELHRDTCSLSARAHRHIMKLTRPGMTERALWGQLLAFYMAEGAFGEGYTSIVASGPNACTLHYVFNDQPLMDGDLLLIDSGADKNYLIADITRTFPVNGKFTSAQRDLYAGVLKVQNDVISAVKVGLPYSNMQDLAVKGLSQVMLDLGLFRGKSLEEVISTGDYRKYYPHGIGHFLGMDVHDVGLYVVDGKPRPLEEGMCFTVEPGLYIPFADESAPAELRGQGVRIEDNILVTRSGPEVFTNEAPKELSELESLLT